MILDKISFKSSLKISAALFVACSTLISSPWINGTSWRKCFPRLWRNVALDSLSWAAKDLMRSGGTLFSKIRERRVDHLARLQVAACSGKLEIINIIQSWPLAVFMASEMRRRHAWSAWWTTLLAHFRRSASCKIDDDICAGACLKPIPMYIWKQQHRLKKKSVMHDGISLASCISTTNDAFLSQCKTVLLIYF